MWMWNLYLWKSSSVLCTCCVAICMPVFREQPWQSRLFPWLSPGSPLLPRSPLPSRTFSSASFSLSLRPVMIFIPFWLLFLSVKVRLSPSQDPVHGQCTDDRWMQLIKADTLCILLQQVHGFLDFVLTTCEGRVHVSRPRSHPLLPSAHRCLSSPLKLFF